MGFFMNLFNSSKNKSVKKKEFACDKAEWQWDSCYEAFCEKNNLDELTDEQENQVWRYACNHISYFVAWAIKHDIFYVQFEEDTDMANAVKEEKSNPTDFVIDVLDCCLTRDDIKEEFYPFIDEYYENHYMDDFNKFFEKNFDKNNIYYTEFDWKYYPELEKILDERYNEFQNSNSN